MTASADHIFSPFNSPVESGLRALVLLYSLFPTSASLQRLVVFDYLLIHSDDVPDGPEGLHPRTHTAAVSCLSEETHCIAGLSCT